MNWRDIGDIDLEEKRLRWYRWDEAREMLTPLEEFAVTSRSH